MLTSDRPVRRMEEDQGVVLVLMALLITVMLLIVAIVIDFGNVRNTRQDTKRIADLATAAGLADLAPDGKPRPWAGACTALDYLQANRPGLTVTYWDGSGPAGGSSQTDPCPVGVPDPDDGDVCVPGDPTTQAWIRAEADGLTVDIRTGYITPDPSFNEDDTVYSGDDGDPALGGCDQLAVITRAADATLFGGIAGATGYETANRSVGRVEIDNEGDVAVALVLLEQEDCLSLIFSGGGNSGGISVKGTDDRPGIIHSDSDGTGSGCPNSPVIRGKQNNGPRVRAFAAPADPDTHGILSTYHRFLGGTNDAKWTSSRTAQGTEVWMCDPDPEGVPSPILATCSTSPTGGNLVERTPADDRFLSAVTSLRSVANGIFGQISSDTLPVSWLRYQALGGSCTMPGNYNSAAFNATLQGLVDGSPPGLGLSLYVDCPSGLTVSQGKELIIPAGFDDVAFQSHVSFQGNGLLDIRSPRKVYVNGPATGAAIDLGAQGRLRVNENATGSCTARHAQDRTAGAVTEMVIRRGHLAGAGGGSLTMCSTFVHLMGGAASTSPVDVTADTYPAPYDNSLTGYFEIGGGGGVEWTAPNTSDGEADYAFEDLAVWAEASSANQIRGGGNMVLKGIFFLPNTAPLDISGTSSGDINLDAQLWVRKIDHNGNAQVSMRANPADSILVPFLAGMSLVR